MAQQINKPAPEAVKITRPNLGPVFVSYQHFLRIPDLMTGNATAEFLYTHNQVHEIVQQVDPTANFTPPVF